MNFLPTSTACLLLAWVIWLGPSRAQSQNPGAAVASEAAATQPKTPGRLTLAKPGKNEKENPAVDAEASAPASTPPIDPLLDPRRPRNAQLTLKKAQEVRCGEIMVVLPEGVYKQILLAENPEGRRATDSTNLKRQQVGLGYIRYLSDAKLSVNDQPRLGGLDVPIRAEDNLPVRIWYKKMTEVDDVTKAFTFILPPVGLIAGAGAWSSGNVILPDSPPVFEEARDYYLKQPKPEADPAEVPQPAHVRPIRRPQDAGSSSLRSK